jgi:rod shape-determining protein MreC
LRDTKGTRLLLSLALVVAFALIAVSYRNSSSGLIKSAKSAAGTVFGTAERAVSTVTRPIGRFFESGLSGSGNGQVTSLRQQLIQMRAELSAVSLGKAQYRELQRMLQIGGRGGYRVLAASVVGFGQGFQQTVTLDAGSSSGVRPQMTVIDGDGLVGQVVSVSARTCTVLLATDATSVVGVRVAPGGQIGWVTGRGPGGGGATLLKLQVLDPAALKVGAQLVTAASVHDRPFVPGVPVGTIVSVRSRAGALTGRALVRPFAAFATLDIVGIVVSPPRHNPRFAVLPPKPAPSPSPTPSPSRSGGHSLAGRPHGHP